MYGAQSLVRTLVDSGVEVTFANPGTSEMHLVTAIDTTPGMRAVLGLFEGVVTGMADGYARIAEKPAATLLHLGPGLANGLANLHNARRASSPVVNIVGDHATHHLQLDAPLTSDIVGFARPVSGWVHTATHQLSVGSDAARAVQAARQHPGQIATLILPADVAWTEGGVPAPPLPVAGAAPFDAGRVSAVADAVRAGRRVGILMRGEALKQRGLTAAGRVATAGDVRLMADTFSPRIQKGAGRVQVTRLPYFAEQLVEYLADLEVLVIVGTKPPVTFFAYPGKPSWGAAEHTEIIHLALAHQDTVGALEALAETLGVASAAPVVADLRIDDTVGDKFDGWAIGRAIARHLPEGAIIADEGGTSGGGAQASLATCVPHDQISLTGGSIGQGLPVATGAAVAAPDRKVVCLHGDGGAMYTVQALWTQARERLDVTTVIFANRSYAILNIELQRTGAGVPGAKARAMLDLSDPTIDWVQIARGMGVEAVRAETPESFEAAFSSAMRQRGPRLIEARL
ncbi:MAG: acetolactate synthase large subunit [Actinobacteria bacterium]|nr:acetolactate synthase large subunit [Actinomycetota bacterium]